MPLKHTKSTVDTPPWVKVAHEPEGPITANSALGRCAHLLFTFTRAQATVAMHISRGYPKGTTRALAPHSSRGIPKCSLNASSPPAACLYLVAPHRFWTGR